MTLFLCSTALLRRRPINNPDSIRPVPKPAKTTTLTDPRQIPGPAASDTSEHHAPSAGSTDAATLRDGTADVTGNDHGASDPLYGQVYEWVKEDRTMTIALVQIRLRLGYGRARKMVLCARQELGIPTPPDISG